MICRPILRRYYWVTNVTVPIKNGRLNLGTWQGIYLNEHRDRARGRNLVVTLFGELQ